MQAVQRADSSVELCHALQMSYAVLGQAAGPPAYDCDLRLGQGAEDARQLEPRHGCGLVVAAAHEPFGGGSTEEGAQEATALRDSTGELLVHEGCGQQETS